MILRRLLLVLLAAAMAAPASATWSIIAVNVVTREVAVGCATCINYADLARNLPVVRPGLGVANIQSSGDVGGVRKPIIWQGFEDHLPPSEILKDIREFEKDKPEGITLEINDDNLCDIQAVMTGPGATNPTAKQLRACC